MAKKEQIGRWARVQFEVKSPYKCGLSGVCVPCRGERRHRNIGLAFCARTGSPLFNDNPIQRIADYRHLFFIRVVAI
jgi:hypothetical protein